VTKSECIDRIISEMLNPKHRSKGKPIKIIGIKRKKRIEGLSIENERSEIHEDDAHNK
jgi:hypothetical protein